MRTYVSAIIGALLLIGCGGGSPTAPTPPPPPPPPVNIAGAWSGTFESTTYSAEAIVVDLTQVGASVNGTWAMTSGVRARGNVTGTVDPVNFSGTVTYNYTNGPTCTGTFSGSSTVSTINWTSPGFTTGSCGLSARAIRSAPAS